MASRTRRLAGFLSGPGSKLSLAAGASLLIAGFGTIGRYALQVALAQLLGTAGFGLYLTLRRWGELLAILPNRGQQGAAVRFLPGYEAEGRWGLYRGICRHALRLTIGGAIVVSLIGTVVGVLIWTDHRWAAVLAMATIPTWALFRMVQAILQAQHDYVRSSAIDQLLQPGVMGLVLLVAWLVRPTIGLDWVMVGLLVSVAVAALAAVGLARRNTPNEVLAPTGPGPAEESDVATWRPAARQFFTHHLSATIIGSADLLILAMFASRSDVGLYGVATRMALLARVVSSGTDSIVAPRISASWSARNMEGLQRNVDKAIVVATPPTLLLVAALIPLRGPVLGVMGDDFRAAGGAMVVLLIGIAVQALTGPCGNVVGLTDNERFNARTMVGAAVFLVVGCFIAAPTGGLMAVAVVTTITNTGWNLVLVVFARKRLGIRCYPYPSMFRSLSIPDWARPGR